MTEDELSALEPGTGVYWHEPTPPYRLWFGVVVGPGEPGEVVISIPGRGQLVHARANSVHRQRPANDPSCPYCQAGAGTLPAKH